MIRRIAYANAIVVVAVTAFSLGHHGATVAETSKPPMLAHNVFFSLKTDSPDARKELVGACKRYLSNHPGTAFFAAGEVAEGLDREVNDRDFHVALHIVFENRAAHDKYQDAKLHKQFIEEQKDNWAKVRVFDSDVSQ